MKTASDYFTEPQMRRAIDRMQDNCSTAKTAQWLGDIEKQFDAHGTDMPMNDQTADFIRQRGEIQA